MFDKKLGIIGGMGPLASAVLLELITEYTPVSADFEHIVIDMVSNPRIPDRTDYILGKSNVSPAPVIKDIRVKLEQDGCEVIAIPCNTAFCFYDEICEGSKAAIINPIVETVKALKEAGVNKVGIMATDGTIKTGLFQKELIKASIEPVVPDTVHQQKVMKMIYDDVKSGKNISKAELDCVKEHLMNMGAKKIILGCTELSMAKRKGICDDMFIDTLEVIANIAVKECR